MEVFEADKLVRTLFNNFKSLLVFVFHAKWSQESQQYLQNFTNLIQTFGPYENVKFFSIEAETCPQILEKYQVEIVPTVIFTQTDKTILKRFTKQLPAVVFESLDQQLELFNNNFEKNRAIWHPLIDNILNSSPFIIFIKGTPQNPKCGFTSQLLQILDNHQLQYAFYDIIADEQMRYWLRHSRNYPTYPQIYIKGQLIGGLDALREIIAKDQFQKIIPAQSKKQSGQQRFKTIISQNKNVVFLSGFQFENTKSEETVQKIRAKTPELYLINALQDNKLVQYFKSNNISLPAYFQSGQQVTDF